MYGNQTSASAWLNLSLFRTLCSDLLGLGGAHGEGLGEPKAETREGREMARGVKKERKQDAEAEAGREGERLSSEFVAFIYHNGY